MEENKTWREIIREELKKLSQLTWGQRLGYIWDYYKPLMAAVIAVIFIISIGVTIYHNLQLTTVLQAYLVNCNALSIDVDEMTEDFSEYLGGLDKKEVLLIDTGITLDDDDRAGYAQQMKFTTLSANGDMDVILFPPELFEKYQKEGMFLDLTTILSEEQQNALADYFVYGEDQTDGEDKVFGLNVQQSPVLGRYDAYCGDPVYAVVMGNAKHTDACDDFLSYLMEQ